MRGFRFANNFKSNFSSRAGLKTPNFQKPNVFFKPKPAKASFSSFSKPAASPFSSSLPSSLPSTGSSLSSAAGLSSVSGVSSASTTGASTTGVDGESLAKKDKCFKGAHRKQPGDLNVYSQLVNNIMKDGKKALAIRHVQGALEHLQSLIEKHNETSSTLITGSTLENLEQAIDKVSPLIRIVSEKAGAKTRLIPRLLNDRRRRRTGIMYVLESIKTPGKLSFQDRLGQELFRILEGTSKVMDKRDQVHKTGLANRSNVILNDRKKKGRF